MWSGPQDKFKERSASVSNRTMSEADQADVARIHRSIDAARTKYEHVKWRSEDSKAQEPEVDRGSADGNQNRAEDAEQVESSTTDAEDGLDVRFVSLGQPISSNIIIQEDDLAENFSDISSSSSSRSTPAYDHPLSAVSGPTSLDGEKKLAVGITVHDMTIDLSDSWRSPPNRKSSCTNSPARLAATIKFRASASMFVAGGCAVIAVSHEDTVVLFLRLGKTR